MAGWRDHVRCHPKSRPKLAYDLSAAEAGPGTGRAEVRNRPTVAPGRPLVGAGQAGSSPGQGSGSGTRCGRAWRGPWVHGQNRKIGNFRKRTGSGDRAAGATLQPVANVVREPDASRPDSLGMRGPVVRRRWRHGIRERAAIRYPSRDVWDVVPGAVIIVWRDDSDLLKRPGLLLGRSRVGRTHSAMRWQLWVGRELAVSLTR